MYMYMWMYNVDPAASDELEARSVRESPRTVIVVIYPG